MSGLYIVKLSDGEFIHTYSISDKSCVVSDENDAYTFNSRIEAGWVADRFGGAVVEKEAAE